MRTQLSRLSCVFVMVVLAALTAAAQPAFSPRQRAWFFRVTAQTLVLQQSCADCFAANPLLFTVQNPDNGPWLNYNMAEELFTSSPDSLTVDFTCLQGKSHGLLAELAVKTTLWELAYHLRAAIASGAMGTDTVFAKLAATVAKKLPEKERRKMHSGRTQTTLAVVMHPSLPVVAKQEKLLLLKYEPRERELLMDAWSVAVTQWVTRRSNYYFKQLAGSGAKYDIKLMAVGDGSGTAGLLDESEPHPMDPSRAGHGVGIGLFTYQFATKGETVVPLSQTATSLQLPQLDTVAVHCSLYGLNSLRKPMIVLTTNNKSYHLFTGNGILTPDAVADDGISYIDRIRKTVEKNIDKPLVNLEKEGGLGPILDNEMAAKEKLERQISPLEREIDSLQRIVPVNQAVIDARKRQINTLLSNIASKNRRITDLARKIDAVRKKVDQQRSVVAEMEALLGPNPQSYQRNGTLFTFADGVLFDTQNQDMLFPSAKGLKEMTVRLIAASLTMGGASKDEVQMFVNVTDAKNCVLVPAVVQVAQARIDTTLRFHYWPDAFAVKSADSSLLAMINVLGSFGKIVVRPAIVQLGEKPGAAVLYSSLQRERQAPFTPNGAKRTSTVHAHLVNDTLFVDVVASADVVATRLSALPADARKKLGVSTSNWDNNRTLAVLRALWLAKFIEQHAGGRAILVFPANEAIWNKVDEVVEF